LAEEYERTLGRLKEIRGQLADHVIKALIKGALGPGDCTELAVSQRLGMPRSTVRKVMQELASEGILEVEDLGIFKPYKVKSLVEAIEKGYVSFTKGEFEELFSVGEIGLEGRSGLWGNPFVGDEVRGKLVQRFLSPSQRSSIRGLLRRFHEFEREDLLWKRLVESYGEDELKEIWLMFPEQVVVNDAIESYRRLSSDWIPIIGEMEPPDLTPDQAREILSKTVGTKLSSALKMAERFAKSAEKEGYQQLAEKLSKEKDKTLLKESVWAFALSLRYGSKLGKKVGVSEDLANRLDEMSCRLESLIENQGKAMKGKRPLKGTAKKQQQSLSTA